MIELCRIEHYPVVTVKAGLLKCCRGSRKLKAPQTVGRGTLVRPASPRSLVTGTITRFISQPCIKLNSPEVVRLGR
jgi:hypothetical protein